MELDAGRLALFLVPVVALIVSPGPDTILILRNALGAGARTGWATMFGVQVGLLGHTAMAALGVSLVISQTPWALRAVAVTGALYLTWIAIRGWNAGYLPIGVELDTRAARRLRPRRGFVDAMLTNLLNPKVILMFLALLPQFMDAGKPLAPQAVTLSAVIIAINMLWQGLLVVAAGGIRAWLDRPRVQIGLSRGFSLILFAFAVLMLAEHVFGVL
jgi:threonine/homoserine/homoserine lactone efflux protein